MRIGIANDSAIAVEALRRALLRDPQHRVVWIARDGSEAVDCCAKDVPDLILMDLLMPRMGGVEATRRIMAATPCAIVIATLNPSANTRLVYEAMGFGALDVIDTPVSSDDASSAAPLVAKIDLIRRLLGDNAAPVAPLGSPSRAVPRPGNALVGIGASAGGPSALAKLLSGLPDDFGAAVVVVQHVDNEFVDGLARWLREHSALPVRVAREGEGPEAGTVLLAATAGHLTLKRSGVFGYIPDAPQFAYRPSIDVFFRSVERFWKGEAIGVLLTGMGRDGALGLKGLRDGGRHTIAQDRASSAVYGMPKAAAEVGAAIDILPLDSIAPRLIELVTEPSLLRATH